MTKFLDKAYDHAPGADAEALYDDWAESYDDELIENGYVTPQRCAAALAGQVEDKSLPILDLGCGTGLSGAALAAAGFAVIDGWDPSAEMLRRAKARGVYRALTRIEPDAPLAAPAGAYHAVNAAGVLSPGLAPPEALDQMLAFLPKGGRIVFSLNDHALADGGHKGRVMELTDTGAATVTFREYGEHIRARKMGSCVYALRKS